MNKSRRAGSSGELALACLARGGGEYIYIYIYTHIHISIYIYIYILNEGGPCLLKRAGRSRFGSTCFGSGLFKTSSVRFGSVRTTIFLGSTWFGLRCLGRVVARSGSVRCRVRVRFRPVPELHGSARFGSVRFGSVLIPSWGSRWGREGERAEGYFTSESLEADLVTSWSDPLFRYPVSPFQGQCERSSPEGVVANLGESCTPSRCIKGGCSGNRV